jgi:hypothetical protein
MLSVPETELSSLFSEVVHCVCPMCRSGYPVLPDGYHPNGQPCYAKRIKGVLSRYESSWIQQNVGNAEANPSH